MFASTVDVLTELAFDAGYLLEMVEGKTYVMPRGYARVFVTVGGMMGLRWSIASDEADTARVKTTVREMLASFSELKQPSHGHAQFRFHRGRMRRSNALQNMWQFVARGSPRESWRGWGIIVRTGNTVRNTVRKNIVGAVEATPWGRPLMTEPSPQGHT